MVSRMETGSLAADGGDPSHDVEAASRSLARLVRSGETAGLQALLDKDFTFIDLGGAVHAGAEALAGTDIGSPRQEANMRDYGAVALVTDRRSAASGEIVAVEAWAKRPEGWRLLVYHLNTLADPEAPPAHPVHVPRPADAPPAECSNPCVHVPYEPASQAERDIIASFQTLENAVVRNDADEWVRHMADEFVVYRTGQTPTTRDTRAAALRRQKEINAEIFVAAVESMRLWVLGDAAVMRADHLMPGNRRPPYRATRVWVKRDGRWQMAVSQQTTRAA